MVNMLLSFDIFLAFILSESVAKKETSSGGNCIFKKCQAICQIRQN